MTRYSSQTSRLAASIPAWVDLAALDGSDLYGYGHPIPNGGAGDLIAAAHEHRTALVPADLEDTDKVLRGLRSATILRDEDAAEARASFAMLRTHLSDVPLDILTEGCRLYCNAPGRRFFPRSAGELRAFIGPLLHRRAARAHRLERIAKRAHEEQRERERLAADPVTPEITAAIMAEFGIRSTVAPAAAAPASRVEASISDYLELGLSDEEAHAAVEQRRRLLSRARSSTVAAAAGRAVAATAQKMGEEA